MERKYLPIGTVCTIKGQNKKVMITGFYSPKFNGNMIINDYVGCFYPEGMLVPEGVISFNHNEIENIDYLGFKNEENEKFQRLLDQVTGNVKEEEKTEETQTVSQTGIFSKIVFDENGVVTLAEPVVSQTTEAEEERTPYFSNIQFDENGYVVRADTSSVDNPFYKEYEADKKVKEVPENKWKIFDKIEFDDNGMIVEANGIKYAA
jgi:hypothetical protein